MTGLLSETDSAHFRDRLLSRLDPRLKLVLLLLLVITIFSASGFGVLFCVGLLAIGLLAWQPSIMKQFLQRILYLRWLLIFTLLLHLFLTPGRTLFGLRMLSYDGLLRGVMVDLQLLLALFFTLCFALFTESGAVAWAATKLLSPLGRLGLPVSGAGRLLVLVLHFLPQVFQHGAPLVQKSRLPGVSGATERIRRLIKSIGDLILVLVEQADCLALEINSGINPLSQEVNEFCWQRIDSICLVLGLPFILACWSL
jgi:energy-coupling factor transport system permease protein